MKTILRTTLAVLLIAIISLTVFFSCTPMGRITINTYKAGLQKADDSSLYQTIKKVEDEARAMVASYNADKLKYEQYKKSEDKQQLEWAEQAKMRANQTAVSYNEFMLKNNYVFKGNIPSDINFQLMILE